MEEPKGWSSRGYIPHYEAGEVPQFVTWRTADAVPKSVISEWHDELRTEHDDLRRTEIMRRIEAYCDQGHGECLFKSNTAALRVQDALLAGDGEFCRLHAWVVMPNHVHCIVTPMGHTLEKVVGLIKGVSARRVNQLLGRQGPLWQREYFDRRIRNFDHFERTKAYIEWNPVKAGLREVPSHWTCSSASNPD